ncbi:DUF6894 family protein [Dongia soli]|uniref:DUF6894 domain-containing protein n=1 Tax=Dongia soli TaxID=600628 RepID=A0ABU5EF20_9PROT|nr:hypothetical protein [Dongia soli]MDY0884772.1 hypothetical protein [Dongia soli]
MRYYFDIDSGRRATRDQIGSEFARPEDVRAAAIRVLPDIARDEWPDGDCRVMIVKVRDHKGSYVFQASLSLVSNWLDAVGEDDLL